MLLDARKIKASLCRDSFYSFFKMMWPQVVAEELQDNWHIKLMCDELQGLAERVFRGMEKINDLVINVSPGTSKSSIVSVMFPPWTWTRDATMRHLCGSYSYPLALDLSRKSRDVVTSDLYRELFPEVQLRADQNTKGYFQTDKGGYRYSFGVNGSVTGFHGHFICLPWESLISTDRGLIPIGKIVDTGFQCRIMTFNHKTGETRWQPVKRYIRNPARPLSRIVFGDGSVLEATDNHPVYVTGKGYVRTGELTAGDEVICRGGEYEVPSDVRPVQDDVPLHHQKAEGVEVGSAVLLVGVQPGGQASRPECLRGVREGSEAGSESVLQPPVSGENPVREKSPPVGEGQGVQTDLPGVRVEVSGQAGRHASLLLDGVQEPRAFQEAVRGGERQLPARPAAPAVFVGVRPDEEENPEAGTPPVSVVRQDAGRKRAANVRPPSGLRQGQQLAGQPGGALQSLPRDDARQEPEGAAAVGAKRVVRVDRAVRIPAAVYDLEVAEDHNFFADGVLVHNCVDDPLDPAQAASDLDRAAANRWIDETLSSRKVSKTVTPTVLVMQRLHQDDPTALFLKRGGVRHVRLPARDDGTVKPRYLRKHYKGGLMDPVRLPQSVLDEAARTSEYYLACTPAFTPILMGNWKEKPISEVRAGDTVIGYTLLDNSLDHRRPYATVRKARVLETHKGVGTVLKYTTDTGREFYCTPDHKWWTRRNPTEKEPYRKAYAPVHVGKEIYSVYKPWDKPDEVSQRRFDWLGGFIDGEGSCKYGNIAITQSENANPGVSRFIEKTLKNLEIDYTHHLRHTKWGETNNYMLVGGRSLKIRLLNNAKMAKAGQIRDNIWEYSSRYVSEWSEKVVAVETVGEMPVYALTTESGNYVAWGFASQNSQFMQSPIPREGGLFKVTELIISSQEPKKWKEIVRAWDKAGSTQRRSPWTVGIKMGLDQDGRVWVLDVKRFQLNSYQREAEIKKTAKEDGRNVRVVLEQEPGSGGKESAQNTVRSLHGFNVAVIKVGEADGDKEMRAQPYSSQVNGGNVYLKRHGWNKEYVQELAYFPFGTYKDQVDASSLAYNFLAGKSRRAGSIKSRRQIEEIVRQD